MKIHHLGILVSDVDETLVELGLTADDIVESLYDANQDNHIHIISLLENNLMPELAQSASNKSTTARFAEKHRIGLHHLAVQVDDCKLSSNTIPRGREILHWVVMTLMCSRLVGQLEHCLLQPKNYYWSL